MKMGIVNKKNGYYCLICIHYFFSISNLLRDICASVGFLAHMSTGWNGIAQASSAFFLMGDWSNKSHLEDKGLGMKDQVFIH